MAIQVSAVPAEARIIGIAFDGLVASRACWVLAKLRIADLLAQGPRPSDELATKLGVHPRALYRLLRCLSTIGLVSEGADRRFALTELGAVLRSDHPASMRASVEYLGEPYYLQSWVDILHTVQTGRPSFDHVHGKPFFTYLADHPEDSRAFDEGMTAFTSAVAADVLAAYDFSPFRRVVDVGGGRGSLLFAILRANRTAAGVLFDLPHVIAEATQEISKVDVAARCELVAGDFFSELPSGDVYVLKWILHDWDDAACARILANLRRAIAPRGKVLLVEAVVPPPGVEHRSKIDDIEMMVLLGSQERTEAEYVALLQNARFRLARVVPTTSEFVSVIEAEPA